jgi:hypothetical protein
MNPSMFWIQKIIEHYANLCSKLTEKSAAQATFIDVLKSNRLFELQQFIVKVKLV